MVKQGLMGSHSADVFKHARKKMSADLYATDLDIILIHKEGGNAYITAVFDWKLPDDIVQFTSAVAYKFFTDLGIPVFVVVGNVKGNEVVFPLTITMIKNIDWKEPTIEYHDTKVTVNSWDEFEQRERKLRRLCQHEVKRNYLTE